MRRGPTGHWEITATHGETVKAFHPDPLPPAPPLALSRELQQAHSNALLALGRLDGATDLLPDTALFLYSYVRKEALLSSQIEGTQSSLSELLLFEIEEAPGIPGGEVAEVARYVAAMEHGLKRLRDGFPLSNRLVREIHSVLLSGGRGSTKDPGSFRISQNWIGGTRPGNALFVPPPPNSVQDHMSALESFLHSENAPILTRTALAHVQFESIHPFLDGNGRVGRLLITLLLCEAKVLKEPLLYLSLYFKNNRSTYYSLLEEVRREGTWESWLEFFYEGVRATSEAAIDTVQRLLTVFNEDHEKIQQLGRAAGSALRVHGVLKAKVVTTLREVAKITGLSFPAASSGMSRLEALGIARELTGKKRNRMFGYDRYIQIVAEGTEPLVS